MHSLMELTVNSNHGQTYTVLYKQKREKSLFTDSNVMGQEEGTFLNEFVIVDLCGNVLALA